MGFTETIETVGKVIDAIGVGAIALGGLLAAGMAIGRLLRRNPNTYRLFRGQLGRAILLGLELLVAADIIRTVAITPTLESVGVLAGIVLIRTFLSWSLELEITGRWPWQKEAVSPGTSAPAGPAGPAPEPPASDMAQPTIR
ncbi:DUF1622 domain-containing protein [Mycolicibacterium confluentis]|uniref:Uncharacterized protein n=1 Tax=Mycolicibacterium confluentis TaxID=28047 RepID=A0A7I7Y518_9MYCO|nr:DUF1622 domain-containing protein [Mycolicibacterium confluentis]MCV7319116.1 DUF1622 domain-containing protein [Mycolicibacterium confluentis]ORV24837.1 hypothetical protein AWB99_04920 [Mycolicibacterium confluentis]BBZ36729.1 hypothetical protein MCNF_53340 [Mycolicibacterium confluentis]